MREQPTFSPCLWGSAIVYMTAIANDRWEQDHIQGGRRLPVWYFPVLEWKSLTMSRLLDTAAISI